jgi:tetratricopeptide (TPR) repeat protein
MESTESRHEKNLTDCRKITFVVFSLSVLVFAVYSNTFDAAWQFDDFPNIVDRKAIHLSELSWPKIKAALVDDRGVPQRPVSCFSLAMNYYFDKEEVGGYHVVNIFIHLLTSVFLFLFIYEALGRPVFKSRWMPYRYPLAFLATLLWSLNPIQTQAVTYIVQRMTSLAGMFTIISLYLYLKARTSPGPRRRVFFYLLCGLSALLAMGSKENAFMIPVSIYAVELILLRDPSHPGASKRFQTATIAPAIGLAICFVLAFLLVGNQSLLAGYERRTFTWTERLLTQPRVLLFYLSLIYYPAPTRLSIDHDFFLSSSLIHPPSTLPSIVLIAGLVASAVYFSKALPFVSFSILFFFLNHLIEASFLPLEIIFEHRNYVPSMFLFVPVSMLICYGIYEAPLKPWTKKAIVLFVLFFLIAFGHGTFVRNMIWKTEESLWMNAAEIAPALWRPWHNLGKYYAVNQSHELALSHYVKALSKNIHPNENDKKMTHYNMGHLYQSLGDKEKAFFHYLQAEKIDPRFAPACNNRAVLLAEKGQRQEAIRELRQCIEHMPDLAAAHINLGKILLEEKRLDEAIPSLEKSLQLEPTNAMAWNELGSAYRQKGLLGKAYTAYQKAMRYQPKDLSPLLYLAELYAFRGMDDHKDKAMARFLRLLPEADLMKLIGNLKDPTVPNGGVCIDRDAALDLLSEALDKRSSRLRAKAESQKK